MHMADIETDVLVIGTGPAGSAAAALLSTYGVNNMVINRYRWLSNTPRAHITNQRTMEVLRDLGRDVEAEAYMHASEQEIMGENIFCTSLAGEELGRLKTWGTHPNSKAEHLLSSPALMNDLPQTFMEPLLFKTACSRGSQARMSTEYVAHEQDAEGVTTTCLDRLTGKQLTVRSKYLIGADGGNSKVAEHAGLPFEGKMGVGGSMNILFKADLSKYVAHRPSVLYWVLQPGAECRRHRHGAGAHGQAVERMADRLGLRHQRAGARSDAALATKVARDLIGDPKLEIELTSVSTWTVNNRYATRIQNGRVFCMGDAIHRHPPSNGLGSNTSIQDAFNLAWKLSLVLKGKAGPGLLDSYDTERAPIARQIVTRANQSIEEFGPIFGALGLLDSIDPVKMQENMDRRCEDSPGAEEQRQKLREAIAFKVYEFDAHGVEMNQRYVSTPPLPMARPSRHSNGTRNCISSRRPGPARACRMPGCSARKKRKASTLDLCGHGRFTLLTGISGERMGWRCQICSGKVRHRARLPRHRPAPGVAGPLWRLGARKSDRRFRRGARPP
jgi:2,4-dichlorophenol 6-monooxygenase